MATGRLLLGFLTLAALLGGVACGRNDETGETDDAPAVTEIGDGSDTAPATGDTSGASVDACALVPTEVVVAQLEDAMPDDQGFDVTATAVPDTGDVSICRFAA